jgi:hypothetical protein
VNDSREAAGLIRLTDAAGPALLRACRYAYCAGVQRQSGPLLRGLGIMPAINAVDAYKHT